MVCHPAAVLAGGDHGFASIFLLLLERNSSGLSLCRLEHAADTAVLWRSKFSILQPRSKSDCSQYDRRTGFSSDSFVPFPAFLHAGTRDYRDGK